MHMAEMQGLSERLVVLRKQKGLTQDELAHELGLSKSGVSKFENGKSNPLPENLVKLSTLFDVSVDYLLTGAEHSRLDEIPQIPGRVTRLKGNSPTFFPIHSDSTPATDLTERVTPATEDPSYSYRQAEKGVKPRVQIGMENERGIAFVSKDELKRYASEGFKDPDFIRHLPIISLPGLDYSNGAFRCFEVVDDSMEDTFYSGDLVICYYIPDWTRYIEDHHIHVVVSREKVMLKRILITLNRKRDLGDQHRLTLLSDNPTHSVQHIDYKDVNEVWVAIGRFTWNFDIPRFSIPYKIAKHQAEIVEIGQRLDNLEKPHSNPAKKK